MGQQTNGHGRRQPGLTRAVDAIYGQRCKVCERQRTLNPSGRCSPCLGKRACFRCKGEGWFVERSTGYPTGCGACQGSGVRA